MTTKESAAPLTYGEYLRVPDLLSLQTPVAPDDVHDEMLFIILQQVQELWFKQILHELRAILTLLDQNDLLEATRLLNRVNRILRVLAEEVEVMETLPPMEFQRFRPFLKSASGFESEQFRELELASGLCGDAYLKIASRIVDLSVFYHRWPTSLDGALRRVLSALDPDPVQALVVIYTAPREYPELFALAEALTEYEVRFGEWRFHHLKLVERVIGDRATGTGGSAGSGYLMRTIGYRFFPELWEARNRLTARSGGYRSSPPGE